MDQQQNDYQAEWEDLDEKVILAQILSELQQIRLLLAEGTDGRSSESDETDTYECVECSATVTAAERKEHAYHKHKAPADMVDGLFTPVE